MRLLELQPDGCSEPRLVEFSKEDLPQYAILSHTWGDDSEEVNFQDLATNTGKLKRGYRKIQFCVKQAAEEGLSHFWIDTCCIDKKSSAELSEAIISMFDWYHLATVCFVYLSDVSSRVAHPSMWEAAFQRSRWFKRGWTLQELLAPRCVKFFSSEGTLLGDKRSLEQEINRITGIAIPALRGTDLSEFTVWERKTWAEHRQTKREEDQAYCLLGIFGVHLTARYGEGRERAMGRLQKKIDQVYTGNATDGAGFEAQVTHSQSLIQTFTIEVGNVHRYVPQRGANQHDWTFFVRPSRTGIIKEVHVHLHPSFRPTHIVCREAPFEVSRVGWGVFEIAAEVIFKPGYWLVVNGAQDILSEPDRATRGRVTLTWMLDFQGSAGQGSMRRYDLRIESR